MGNLLTRYVLNENAGKFEPTSRRKIFTGHWWTLEITFEKVFTLKYNSGIKVNFPISPPKKSAQIYDF